MLKRVAKSILPLYGSYSNSISKKEAVLFYILWQALKLPHNDKLLGEFAGVYRLVLKFIKCLDGICVPDEMQRKSTTKYTAYQDSTKLKFVNALFKKTLA